jgi:hypothetical protein
MLAVPPTYQYLEIGNVRNFRHSLRHYRLVGWCDAILFHSLDIHTRIFLIMLLLLITAMNIDIATQRRTDNR